MKTIWIGLLASVFLYGTKAAVSSCYARLEGTSGTFTSPNYPEPPSPRSKHPRNTFPDNGAFVTCQWQLVVPGGMAIQLKFGGFNMGAARDDCHQGEVEIFSGVDKNKQSLDKYCSGDSPDTVILPNHTATVIFRRPSTFAGTGFLISYIAIKPGQSIHDFVTCSDTASVRPKSQSFSIVCPSGCAGIKSHQVSGKTTYRDDSMLCLAAIHAGVILDGFGGRVQVKRASSKPVYYGSKANNISSTTASYSEVSIYFSAVEECSDRIKMKPQQFTASSYWNDTKRNRLWLPSKADFANSLGWSPSNPQVEQWIQMDLLKPRNVTAILTQGSSTRPYKWCKSYTIKYSSNGITWTSYKDEAQKQTKLFSANTNHFAEVRNNFVRPRLVARYIRVFPTPVRELAMRFALTIKLNGCDINERVSATPVLPTTTTRRKTTSTTTTTTTTTKKPTTRITTTTTEVPPANTPLTESTNLSKPSNNTLPPVVPVSTNNNPSKTPDVPLNERSIIIIAIVAALAVTSILLAALVLILVRKRKKEPKIETMVPKLTTSQTNATYHAGIDSARFSYKKDEKQNGSKMSGNFLFKNYNYADSYPVNRDVTMQNSRGGVTLLYDEQRASNGEIVTTYTASDVAGPSNALLQPQRSCHDDSDSFQTDDEDHEYQVIPDNVTDYVTNPRTSSKASTASSHHSKRSDGSWGKDQVFPPAHMTSFGGRSRSGTFPHPNSVGEFPISPGPPKTAPAHFTAPRFTSNRKRGGSRSPEHVTSQRNSSSSGGSSPPVTSYPPYYSAVPEATPSGRKASYKTPRSHPFSPPVNNGDVILAGSDPAMSRHNGYETGLRHSSSRGSQQSGYDQLYRPKNPPMSGENAGKCMVVMTTNNYNQLDLHTPV